MNLFFKNKKILAANDGYITMLYLGGGRRILIHDSLGELRYEGIQADCDFPAEQQELDEFASCEPMFLVNPSTGLLMLDDYIDIGGNFFGSVPIDYQ